ncbi:NUDIX hydrolase [Umezakia ovalisporum]|uniref:NUDIX hydrolase n=1 Tax=Umezakia ovalisporum FSS-43 TaxID=2740520 RepID=A0ABT6K2D6_9CYAN|nr:NUDIX hydrolase [Umezakia ovalisporum]MDH6056532.1 NUDIX hydrolase [Umezakia ovalisporum FSS-43]MDH6065772.1 NUDIX hydrolase [Umezakia ovalisporum APH033B]MDH6069282.1 NUDIX hydrolase [Umezakia ovalisporum CobakiLakeA]MDH6076164.1 NUDIX hydrolase [Umezakia ovalisporum CS-1034]MDH6080832.1 NUDIX hydrolase [Umezakia ovalisporum FSS-44]
MNNIKKWNILKSEIVLEHPWCQVRRDEIELPNGKIVDDFFVVVRPEIALILPITNDEEIVFVRQYRHGVGEILLELPAGGFDPGKEDAAVAAVRELKEETGYLAEKVTKLATLYDNPVKDTNKIHLFLAENVAKYGEQTLDVTEDIEIVLVPVESVLNKINQGEIAVAGTIAALFLGLNFLNS